MSSTRTCWPRHSTCSTLNRVWSPTSVLRPSKRSALSRADARVHYDQCSRRPRSYIAATVADIDKLLAGSRTRTLAVLGRWPDLRALARAHRTTIAAVLREDSYCGGRQEQIADQLRSAAAAWVSILEDYCDLDFRRLKVAGMLADIDQAADRFDSYTEQLDGLWHAFYGPMTCCSRCQGPARSPRRESAAGSATGADSPAPRISPPTAGSPHRTGRREP